MRSEHAIEKLIYFVVVSDILLLLVERDTLEHSIGIQVVSIPNYI